jgi:hypothetical protein
MRARRIPTGFRRLVAAAREGIGGRTCLRCSGSSVAKIPLKQMDPHIRRRKLQDAIKRLLLRESLSRG